LGLGPTPTPTPTPTPNDKFLIFFTEKIAL